MMDTDKPHRGTIEDWGTLGGTSEVRGVNVNPADPDVRGYMIAGTLKDRCILTTVVRGQDGNEIETLNGRYTLGTRSKLQCLQ